MSHAKMVLVVNIRGVLIIKTSIQSNINEAKLISSLCGIKGFKMGRYLLILLNEFFDQYPCY